jgi:surfeit locus 1 family protein
VIDTAKRQRGLAVPVIVTAVVFALLIGLGVWQIQRKTWKEDLIATLAVRLSANPIALPPRTAWPSLKQDDAEYQRVTFTADVLTDHQAFVYTNGSSFRSDVSGPGFWVFAPGRLADGSQVVINRGFVSEKDRNALTPSRGPVTITGVMRWPEQRLFFIPEGDRGRNTWFARDQREIAAAKEWGEVAPFYVEQETPTNPGGLPVVGSLRPVLPNNHLQYALTWFGLAAVLLVAFAVWVRGQRRGAASI